MTKIALFGTSADPPTVAHGAILGWLSEHYDRVLVWASDNPFKNQQTALKHRQAMLGLVIEEISSNGKICLYEELSDRRSLISVEKAIAIWGNTAEYTLVIGSDLTGQMQKWYRVQELLQKVHILIIPRPGYGIDQGDLQALRQLGGTWAIADLDVPDVSSTGYRQGKDNGALTPSVKEYIRREHLYS